MGTGRPFVHTNAVERLNAVHLYVYAFVSVIMALFIKINTYLETSPESWRHTSR